MIKLLKVFSDLGPQEIAEFEQQVAEAPYKRAAQKALAAAITTDAHGAEATAAVQAASEALFGKGTCRCWMRRRCATRRRNCPAGRWR